MIGTQRLDWGSHFRSIAFSLISFISIGGDHLAPPRFFTWLFFFLLSSSPLGHRGLLLSYIAGLKRCGVRGLVLASGFWSIIDYFTY